MANTKSGVKPKAGFTHTHPQAKPVTCPKCGARLLAGLDAPVMARKIQIETIPLTPQGEAQAWQAAIPTFELDNGRIYWRDKNSIQARPAHKTPVYPQHQHAQTLARTSLKPAKTGGVASLSKPPAAGQDASDWLEQNSLPAYWAERYAPYDPKRQENTGEIK